MAVTIPGHDSNSVSEQFRRQSESDYVFNRSKLHKLKGISHSIQTQLTMTYQKPNASTSTSTSTPTQSQSKSAAEHIADFISDPQRCKRIRQLRDQSHLLASCERLQSQSQSRTGLFSIRHRRHVLDEHEWNLPVNFEVASASASASASTSASTSAFASSCIFPHHRLFSLFEFYPAHTRYDLMTPFGQIYHKPKLHTANNCKRMQTSSSTSSSLHHDTPSQSRSQNFASYIKHQWRAAFWMTATPTTTTKPTSNAHINVNVDSPNSNDVSQTPHQKSTFKSKSMSRMKIESTLQCRLRAGIRLR